MNNMANVLVTFKRRKQIRFRDKVRSFECHIALLGQMLSASNCKGQVRICSLQLGLVNFGLKKGNLELGARDGVTSFARYFVQYRDRIIVKFDNESKDTCTNTLVSSHLATEQEMLFEDVQFLHIALEKMDDEKKLAEKQNRLIKMSSAQLGHTTARYPRSVENIIIHKKSREDWIPSGKASFWVVSSRRFVPKAPYHSPVRCRIVRRLDGELIRARGSQNHREISYSM
ncbi:hypothetical protein WN51_13002 [Melipona quadrifasciata]|uniref:Uncharacterized protein n=1 Tax=Melipona quadrifasciata TaxID=166423 RepID=A0A0N0BKF8_9HYME|nr:hypothetical protein WN51_13002 [Melipona quadrifasciata]